MKSLPNGEVDIEYCQSYESRLIGWLNPDAIETYTLVCLQTGSLAL